MQGLVLAMLAALVTLAMATRIGIRDIRSWITPETQEDLRRVNGTWRAIAMAAAAAMSMNAPLSMITQAYAFTATSHALSDVSSGSALLLAIVISALYGVFAGLLVTLARIDLCCRLLPDRLTLLLVVTGLGFHWLGNAISITDACIGAITGYVALWLLAWLFKRYRAAEVMGRGDFAMAAGLGAWLGWQLLPLALMIASIAALIAVASSRLMGIARNSPHANPSIRLLHLETAFGPALAFGALASWMAQIG